MQITPRIAEDVLKRIINLYDGNPSLKVRGDFSDFPEYTRRNINDIFNILEMDNMLNIGVISETIWEVMLTPDGISYFENKKSLQKVTVKMPDGLSYNSKHLYALIDNAIDPMRIITEKFYASSHNEQILIVKGLRELVSNGIITKKFWDIIHDFSKEIDFSENKESQKGTNNISRASTIEIPISKSKKMSLNSNSFSSLGLTNCINRSYEQINLLIGENGSGKSRFLHAVYDSLFMSKEIKVIYMDFAAIKPNTPIPKTETQIAFPDKENEHESIFILDSEEQPQLSDAIVFKDPLSQEVYGNFVPFVENNCDSLFNHLSENWQIQRSRRNMETRLNAINKYLSSFLKRNIRISKDGCYITSRENPNESEKIEIAIPMMSPGERVILYFALGILAISIDSQEYVLLIDEPETHLHPNALIGIIKAIKCDLKPACTFIASHSVFLIPQFSFEQTVFFDKSCIKNLNSKMYKDIYESLVGNNDDETQTLHTFLSSIYDWQYAGFLAECFLYPSIVDNPKMSDPQFRKLCDVLNGYSRVSDKKVHILDYGAGSGRIAKCFFLSSRNDGTDNICEHISYSIYDKFHISVDLPVAKWIEGKYSSFLDLTNTGKKFDILVLFNVLHEISVEEWVSEINGMISMLTVNGIIVFGERTELSKGEHPFGKSGYLVLNKRELQYIFGKGNVTEINLSTAERDPTSCFILSPPNEPIKTNNVISALTALRDTTYREICKFRTSKGNGRSYAFYCQQYINALQALDIFKLH